MRALLLLLLIALAGACSQPPCPAWEATGEGECNLGLGYAWDGERCAFLSGCGCEGRDCDLLRGDDDAKFCLANACHPRSDASR